MNKIVEFVPRAEQLVNKLVSEVNDRDIDFRIAETCILDFIYEIGHELLSQVTESVTDPVYENRVMVEGKTALYKDTQTLCFRDRFGGIIRRQRRRYALEGESRSWFPLDEKIGMDKCTGFSPFMSYLVSLYGAHMPFTEASKMLGESLGFSISATAVQKNTENTGQLIPHHPLRIIPQHKQSEQCQMMIVEIDGTMSPQIHEEEGISGRESLKQPTEYKECNIITIEKINEGGEPLDRWTGAHYGDRSSFEQYASQTALKMGQLQAEQVVFLGDGAKHNWEIQKTHFSGSIAILDYYHALEHLGHFCEFVERSDQGKQLYQKWESMIYDGQILQVIHEMRAVRDQHISNRDAAQKDINYYVNNQERMRYDEYRAAKLPIGSGRVEGQCKLVVGKRFKGNGMRWKLKDNEAVLDVRLASLNGILPKQFEPQPREWRLAS